MPDRLSMQESKVEKLPKPPLVPWESENFSTLMANSTLYIARYVTGYHIVSRMATTATMTSSVHRLDARLPISIDTPWFVGKLPTTSYGIVRLPMRCVKCGREKMRMARRMGAVSQSGGRTDGPMFA